MAKRVSTSLINCCFNEGAVVNMANWIITQLFPDDSLDLSFDETLSRNPVFSFAVNKLTLTPGDVFEHSYPMDHLVPDM